jgi:hypothetical protein
MKTSFCSKIVAIAIVALPLASFAADGAWKMPNLNPFAAKGKTASRGHVSDAPTSGWHMPKLWPKAAPARRTASQPSAWGKMTSGTQKFFSKTADTLTPWDNKPAAPPPNITGSNSFFTHNNAAKKESTSSSIMPASWWSSDKKDQPDKSVNDFLSRPRPQPQ